MVENPAGVHHGKSVMYPTLEVRHIEKGTSEDGPRCRYDKDFVPEICFTVVGPVA